MISNKPLRVGSLRLAAAAVVSMWFAFACAAPPEEPDVQQTSSELGKPSEPEPRALSCEDQCYSAGQSCPTECGASVHECAAATQTCYRSCSDGVGPWLPC
jgi:hypothetical protein